MSNAGQGWSNGNNFSPNGIPQSGDSVTIPTGVTLTVKGNIYGTMSLLKVYIYGTMDFDPSGKLNLTVSSLIQIHAGGRITTNGSSSEIISMGGVVKYNGHNDGTVNGPKYASAATSISNGTADDSGFNFGVLPTNILSFSLTRQNDEVALSWRLSREGNINEYVIQKRTKEHWEDIRQGKPDQTLSTNSYFCSDNSPGLGENFYRIKLIYADGRIEYSRILMTNLAVAGQASVYPNPIKTQAVLTIKNQLVNGKITISNMAGQAVYKKDISNGIKQLTLDLSKLENGLHYIAVFDNKLIIDRTAIIVIH